MPAALVRPNLYTGYYAPCRGGVARYPGVWRGCVGAWNPGLGMTGSKLLDSVGRIPPVSITGYASTMWKVVGGVPCLDMNGSTQLINPTAEPAISNAASFSIWVKRTLATGGTGAIFDSYNVGGSQTAYPWSDGTCYFAMFRSVRVSFSPRSDVDRTTWHHLCVTSGPATGYNVYQNGKLAYNTTQGTFSWNSTYFTFGGTVTIPYYWSGQITDAMLFNRDLSAKEVALLARYPGIAYERLTTRRWFVPASSGQNVSVTNVANVQLSGVVAALSGSGAASISATNAANAQFAAIAAAAAGSGAANINVANAANVQLSSIAATAGGSGSASVNVSSVANAQLSGISAAVSGSGIAGIVVSNVANAQLGAVAATITAGGQFRSVTSVANVQMSGVASTLVGVGAASVSVTSTATAQLSAFAAVVTNGTIQVFAKDRVVKNLRDRVIKVLRGRAFQC